VEDHGELRDLPEHSQRAALRACARRAREVSAREKLERAERHLPAPEPITKSLAGDEARRALFLADVSKRVVANGSTHTASYLQRVFRFSKKAAWAVIKEARKEVAAAMETQTDALRGVAEARLERLMRKADAACDLTNYGRALKEWMRLHGLYRADDTTLSDFAKLMQEITASEDGARTAQVVDAEFTVNEDGENEEVEWQEPAGYIPAKVDEEEGEE
jgi:hypothetical protein